MQGTCRLVKASIEVDNIEEEIRLRVEFSSAALLHKVELLQPAMEENEEGKIAYVTRSVDITKVFPWKLIDHLEALEDARLLADSDLVA